MSATAFIDYRGRIVRLTAERRQHLLTQHPEMTEELEKIGNVLARPERVVQSRSDPEAELFYMWQRQSRVGPKYLCVVVVAKADDAFVLTAYLTDTIKKGRVLWPENNV